MSVRRQSGSTLDAWPGDLSCDRRANDRTPARTSRANRHKRRSAYCAGACRARAARLRPPYGAESAGAAQAGAERRCRRPRREPPAPPPSPSRLAVPPDTWLRSCLMSSWTTLQLALGRRLTGGELVHLVSSCVRRWSSDLTLSWAACAADCSTPETWSRSALTSSLVAASCLSDSVRKSAAPARRQGEHGERERRCRSGSPSLRSTCASQARSPSIRSWGSAPAWRRSCPSAAVSGAAAGRRPEAGRRLRLRLPWTGSLDGLWARSPGRPDGASRPSAAAWVAAPDGPVGRGLGAARPSEADPWASAPLRQEPSSRLGDLAVRRIELQARRRPRPGGPRPGCRRPSPPAGRPRRPCAERFPDRQ